MSNTPSDTSRTSAIDEQARLAELRALDILDTQPEERFDRYTRLVSQIFNVPAAFISLIDENRQWFKSSVGIEAHETSHDLSFCVHALAHDYLEIPNALSDEFFCNHKAVVSPPYVRFYAGVVLFGPGGHPIGTFCISDTKPREMTSVERSWLKTFARIVEEQIHLYAELATARQQVSHVTQRNARTGLPDETLFGDTLDNLIRLADIEAYYLAVLHLRVNNLDEISRIHGRGKRDAVLQCMADRLTAPDIKMLAAGHLGYDRFAGVVSMFSVRDLFSVITPIVNRLNMAIDLEGHTLRPDIDVGISVSPDDGTTPDDLLERARAALKGPRAKGGMHVFTHHTEASAVRRHWIEQRLEPALQDDEVSQHYQPIVLADGSGVIGFEALARWNDAELGIVSPGEFVPIAEKTPRLSRLLTDWSLKVVCKTALDWPLRPGNPPLRMGVNIPANQFYQLDFVDHILQTLKQYDLSPERLTLELTEESLLTDISQAVNTMRQLRDHDITLALDDFGTGYSSLNYLKRLPIDALKIDKSFIDDLPHERAAVDLVKGIIRIAHGLGLKVIAEGIEHQAQHDLLKELGCDQLQGYLFSRPVEADRALAFLESWPGRAGAR
ncbi:sensor domain-containing phosphodiesterase [Halomonas sp. ML-15]|uniref:sensor domain-containing phosphodiesterase n=1 Tax=Halomonas sp. ML-15 TaxID=2773305 RepID=UPI001745D906|nr:sensor domain-containing phosphodiesterase [Halomonas sp. ML-15]MBD3896322.1 sensor domain-containing phosphodiesterase [Halomonas sp. ML-15]